MVFLKDDDDDENKWKVAYRYIITKETILKSSGGRHTEM